MNSSRYSEILTRIAGAIEDARRVFERFTPGEIEAEYKIGLDPVTEADRELDVILRQNLLRAGEGWLSEESVDDVSRLDKRQVWVVDPLDGTREFVAGIPEFCISIGFAENGCPVAGGICNPATNETILGAIDLGVSYNGEPATTSKKTTLEGASILASRSEMQRGEWQPFSGGTSQIRPMGSVAYKLALVATGRADATFTLTPKHEWDVVAGAALVKSAGGCVALLDHSPLVANRRHPLISGLIACAASLKDPIFALIESRRSAPQAAHK